MAKFDGKVITVEEFFDESGDEDSDTHEPTLTFEQKSQDCGGCTSQEPSSKKRRVDHRDPMDDDILSKRKGSTIIP